MLSTSRLLMIAAVLVVGIVIFSITRSTSAQDDHLHQCSLAQTAGHYGFVGSGTILAGNPFHLPAGPFSTAGTIDFFPDGHWQTQQTASFNGHVSTFAEHGPWSVMPDCRFSNTESDSQDTGSGAVVDDGGEILLIDTGPDIVATFTMKRISSKP
jgi:hypothetical protein